MLITDKNIIDLGNVAKNTVVPFSFSLTNNSTNILKLDTSVSCGCTKPILETDTMSPFSIQNVTGTYKVGMSVGLINNKHINITSNKGDTVVIKLKGNVL